MRYLKYWLLTLLIVGGVNMTFAHINPDRDGRINTPQNNSSVAVSRMDCAQATAQIDQDINNVRARLLTGGDVWWDGGDAKYIVPNVDPASGIPEVSSIFAGAVWLGGVDPGGNLKVAAQTYGTASGSTDFWPGPLTEIGTVEADTCSDWDRFFTVDGANIREHIQNYELAVSQGIEYDPDLIPLDVKGWPARGNEFFFELNGFELPNTAQGLGAFFDQDGDGDYQPDRGDYPVIEIRGCPEPQFPDEMIFYIYNDAGGLHTESGGDAIQMEVQVQAFAYSTNDEINDMTFQRYKLINRAIESIDSMFFAMWVDADLGCFTDDYVGCDTSRSLAYIYNQDALDGEASCNDCSGVNTYCTDIPIIGVDYFRGPLDENLNELGMSSFTYYNNGGLGPPPGTDDPNVAQEYYNYISGSWRDGTRFTAGGDGYNATSEEFINYAFTETPDDPTGWNMCNEGLGAGDRRTIQASGPFRLDPGAVNELIIGVVWIPEVEYPCPDITQLLFADDIAQALFDNCFDITDGPTAPDVDWIELDKELIAVLTNDVSSNNFEENYSEIDLRAPPSLPEELITYKFEGYKIYQLFNASVSIGELGDADRARLVRQVDVKNGVSKIFNWEDVSNPNDFVAGAPAAIWVPSEQVDGADLGIAHTFRITEDAFAQGNRDLINHKKYYYTAVAYAHNEYEPFQQTDMGIQGQRTPYLEGRLNIQTYTVVPRPIVNEKLNSAYGDGPIITRLEGSGVGGNFVDLNEETMNSIVDGSNDGTLVYEPGQGPIKVQIYNPFEATDGTFRLEFTDSDESDEALDDDARWRLTNLDDGSTIESETTLEILNEQILAEYGFTVSIAQTDDAGDLADESNGAIGAEAEYADPTGPEWLVGITDDFNGQQFFNFVKTGSGEIDNALDPNSSLSTMGDGIFVPYTLVDWRPQPVGQFLLTPAWDDNSNSSIVRVRNPVSNLNNVNLVFTSDKSKWSRCVVVETATRSYTNPTVGLGLSTEGDARMFDLRSAPSVGRDDGNGDGLPDPDDDGTGMGWFPGYAVDVETGQRLNVFFGENSVYDGSLFPEAFDGTPTGRDMMWNPTGQGFLETGDFNIYNLYLAGQHFVYVTNTPYDECAQLREDLSGSAFKKVGALDDVTWTAMPAVDNTTLTSYADGLIPNDVTVKLRVDSPYDIAVGTDERSGHGTYLISFEDVNAQALETEEEVNEALDQINVVPNPYYGYSSYETSQFTNRVKITNLPPDCVITIYTLDGKFIRQYNRNEEGENQAIRSNPGIITTQINPDLEWDLNNSKGIPVASGVYLIHVDAPGLGERTLKWFGVARQFDPSGL